MKRFTMRRLFSILAMTGILASASAQETKELSLKEALEHALQNKAAAKKARLDEQNSTYQIDEVKARALPNISGSGSLTYNPLLQLSALPGEVLGRPGETVLVAFGQKWNSGAAVTLTQNIFDQSPGRGGGSARPTSRSAHR